MIKPKPRHRIVKARQYLLAVVIAAPIWMGGAAPEEEEPDVAGSLSSVMGALGEGTQLIAADDGEFVIDLDEYKDLSTFRAIRDVIVLTEDMSLRCHEMIYDKDNGVITAIGAPGGLVHITMTNVSPEGGIGGGGGDTRATCRLYRFYVKDRQHVLTHDPVIYQKDAQGKETAVKGDRVTIYQDEQGRWRMYIKGNRGRSAPRSETELQRALKLTRARELWGILKPIVNIDMRPPEQGQDVATTATAGAVKLDAASLLQVKQEKSSSLMEIERGGTTRMGTLMPTLPTTEQ